MTVFKFDETDIIKLSNNHIKRLKLAALDAPLRRARYCLHKNENDLVQEMVIAFCRDSAVPVHRHKGKSESFHVIEGEIDIIFYDDDGNPTHTVSLDATGEEKPFIYRLNCDLWHTVKPKTEFVVIHEITTGPFVKSEQELLVI